MLIHHWWLCQQCIRAPMSLQSLWYLLLSVFSIIAILVAVTEKAMATHSSTLAWKIPWMEEPGRLQFMGSRRVRQDWATSLSLFTFMHLRRKWQPTPVFLPGESQGRGSLVGCRLWGHTVRHNWSDLAAAAAAPFLVTPMIKSLPTEQLKIHPK